MTIDKTIKNIIIREWHDAFPELRIYSQNKLYKIAGCLLFGIELIKLPRTEEYRPHFVLYPLWKKNVKECLDFPIVLHEFYDKKKFQFDIPYEKHNQYFEEVSQIIKKQYHFLLIDNISTETIISLIENYSQTKRFSVAPNSFFQADFLETKLKIALFTNVSRAQEILDNIKKRDWDAKHFQACGVEITPWITDLQNEIDKKDSFLKQIETNIQDKKLAKLKASKLI
ncbi:hypothetical protein [Flavobacterium sp. 140616W15]|uniref:hypothetical protein n=1 Tax=Flavobacterium sp. 140616W15 TaxID=2478552 RepID=UPI000F0C96F3|nr:hypothetical protein [Flavobacterium sp. 140616W15]AYN03528.1 hypothetical protein EAG11_04590 [Flavobacterium sp. 140616W15]